jgi:Tfp pilus assembly protein PilF
MVYLLLILIIELIWKSGDTRDVTNADGSCLRDYLFYGCTGLVLTTSYLQWYLSLVSEMYTLNILFVCLIVYLVLSILSGKNSVTLVYLLFFVFGLSLGNRMDIVMIGPGILYVCWVLYKQNRVTVSTLFTAMLLFIAGFTVYLYLPIRSSQNPYFDWLHPASLEKLYASLTRKSHGGTLDLLSASYNSGENFVAGMKFYVTHLVNGLAYLGLVFGLVGTIAGMMKRFTAGQVDRTITKFLVITFVFCCIIFIYLANMPPNPHALVILEAHFLFPNVIFFLLMVIGLKYLYELIKKELDSRFHGNDILISAIFTVLVVGMTAINLYANLGELNKRHNFILHDYTKNMFKSIAPESVVIAKKDVQLFSLWYDQAVVKHRPDVITVAEGLAGSPWYQDMVHRKYPAVYLSPVNNGSFLESFVQNNSMAGHGVYYTGDTELPRIQTYADVPQGLVSMYVPPQYPAKDKIVNFGETLLDQLYVYRGKYDYDEYKEFFTPDIVEDYARSRHKTGYYYMTSARYAQAQRNFTYSLQYHKEFALAAYHLAYTYFVQNDFPNALIKYLAAVDVYKHSVQLAIDYNALPDVKQSISNELADILLHTGVVYEKLGKDNEALDYYLRATEYNPSFAKAFFNRSVVYWGRQDWPNVIAELTKAIQADPNYAEARFYLEKAKRNLGK